MNHLARIVTATAWLALGYGCAPAPVYRPIKVGDVDTGANSVEAVRRQFQGTWTLDNYYVYEFQGTNLWLTINGADGKPTASSSWKKSR